MIKNLVIDSGHIKLNKYKEAQHLLPSKDNIREFVSFNIDYTANANTFRRVALEELYVYFLDFELGQGNININSEKNNNQADDYIIDDFVKDRINSICINQIDKNLINDTIPEEYKKLRFEINIFNDTEEIIYVRSSDIKPTKNSNLKIHFAENIRLVGLNPKCRLHITNIFINKKCTYNDGKLFNISNFRYVPQTIEGDKPYSHNMKSSVTVVKKYQISFNTFGVNGSVLIDNVGKLVRAKLEIMKKILPTTKGSIEPANFDNFYNINLDIIVDGEINYIFKFTNISTLCSLIVDHIIKKMPDIKFVNFENIHPLKNEYNIVISHKDAVKILSDNITDLINEYNF